jgi:hypothetical protein
MNTFGRAACACSLAAISVVLRVSSTRSGETSSEAQPSTPPVRSWIGRNRSAAWARSSTARAKNSSSPDLPARASSAICASYALPAPIAFSKMVGFEVRPVTEYSAM